MNPIEVLTDYLRSQASTRMKTGTVGPKPTVYRVDVDASADAPLATVNGPVEFDTNMFDEQDDPPAAVFFVDDDPDANWEHPCRYIVVRDSGRLAEARDSAPPSARTNVLLEKLEITGI